MPLDFFTNFDWSRLLVWRTAVNIIDILIVAFFIYQLMRIVKGTRAVELLKGIGVILILKAISVIFRLYTTEFIVDFVIQWSALALISTSTSLGLLSDIPSGRGIGMVLMVDSVIPDTSTSTEKSFISSRIPDSPIKVICSGSP